MAVKSAVVPADSPPGFSAHSFLGLPVTLSRVVRTCRVLFGATHRENPHCLALVSFFRFCPKLRIPPRAARLRREAAQVRKATAAFLPKISSRFGRPSQPLSATARVCRALQLRGVGRARISFLILPKLVRLAAQPSNRISRISAASLSQVRSISGVGRCKLGRRPTCRLRLHRRISALVRPVSAICSKKSHRSVVLPALTA